MSSSDLEDDLITYGTALDPLEEDEIPCKKPRLLEDQVVKDKYGRRRFHGAFTGGFSAGFFNTVGSLEGWTPTLFKSSKSKKQEHFQQKPEDFMDEEDMSEFGIAPVMLKAKQDYTNDKSKTLGDLYRSQALGTYVLEDLFKPVRETVGIKLLKKMGWKPGQGVGPRLKKNEKIESLKMQQKTYGCQLPPGALTDKDADSSSGSEWDDVEFAPDDYELILCETRNNFCGLGYQGLDKRLILGENPSKNRNYNITEKNRKMAFGSQAFGVGAFEEEDEDIYARDDMSRYDFALGSDVKKSPEKKLLTVDGILEGFICEKTKHIRKKYSLPTLPKDFNPYHKCRKSRFDVGPSDKKSTKALQLNSESRKKLIENWSEDTELEESKRKKEALIKELSNVKLNTSNAFKPFSSNPEKQERYENYLKLVKIGKKESLNDIQPLSMTNSDKEREKAEFEKAASLFKPLSGEMGERFLTASQPDDLSDPLAVVEKFRDDADDKRRAAKMNMFGPLTRKTEDWAPCQLLCKRFNIPQPTTRAFDGARGKESRPNIWGEIQLEQPPPIPVTFSFSEQSVQKKSGKRNFDLFTPVENPKSSAEQPENVSHFADSLHEETKETELKKDEPFDAVLNDVSDKADLFKAIFLDSDDDEDEDGKKGGPGEEKSSNSAAATGNFQDVSFEETLINSKRNSSPPSGIFENIDLELLSSARKRVNDVPSEKVQKSQNEPPEALENDCLPSSLVYGPKIPERTAAKTVVRPPGNLREDEIWVEKKIHSKKHKKKDKKYKKSSHKVKHKHKKHKR